MFKSINVNVPLSSDSRTAFSVSTPPLIGVMCLGQRSESHEVQRSPNKFLVEERTCSVSGLILGEHKVQRAHVD